MAEVRTLTHHELVEGLSALLRRAAAGEDFLITMDGRPMAKLRPFVESPPYESDVNRVSDMPSSKHRDA